MSDVRKTRHGGAAAARDVHFDPGFGIDVVVDAAPRKEGRDVGFGKERHDVGRLGFGRERIVAQAVGIEGRGVTEHETQRGLARAVDASGPYAAVAIARALTDAFRAVDAATPLIVGADF